MAATIEEAKLRNAAAEGLATGAPLDLSAYQQYQAHSQQKAISQNGNLPYFIPPPKGYVGPLPPAPPPPMLRVAPGIWAKNTWILGDIFQLGNSL